MNVGVLSAVMSSWLLAPVSLEPTRSGWLGLFGAGGAFNRPYLTIVPSCFPLVPDPPPVPTKTMPLKTVGMLNFTPVALSTALVSVLLTLLGWPRIVQLLLNSVLPELSYAISASLLECVTRVFQTMGLLTPLEEIVGVVPRPPNLLAVTKFGVGSMPVRGPALNVKSASAKPCSAD